MTSSGQDDDRESMLELSAEEAASLQLAEVYVDYRREAGKVSKGPTFNYKKLSVVRVEWLPEPVASRELTVRARAAFRYYQQHPTYARYLRLYEQWRSTGDPQRKWKTAYTLLNADGVEVAIRPILYPHHSYGDSDQRARLRGVRMNENQQLHMRHGLLRKLMSPCLAYQLDVKWMFLVMDIMSARRIMAIQKIAVERQLPPDLAAQNRSDSESYWRREQDYLCDIVRQMRLRQEDPVKHPRLYAYAHGSGVPRSLAYPNVFITIAPAEWRFPLHYAIFQQWKHPEGHAHPQDLSRVQGLLTMHLHNVLTVVMSDLLRDQRWFEEVYEHVIRIEFQERGTLHLHVALWALLYDHVDLRGNSQEGRWSDFIRVLSSYGFDHIDVQYGEGFLNYINGYTSKASDAMDFRLDQHTMPGASHQWRTCYRLLCKQVICVPEIMATIASLPLMVRSFHVDPVVAPTPKKNRAMALTESGRQYLAYMQHWCGTGTMPLRVVSLSFMEWMRKYTHGAAGPLGWKWREVSEDLSIDLSIDRGMHRRIDLSVCLPVDPSIGSTG